MKSTYFLSQITGIVLLAFLLLSTETKAQSTWKKLSQDTLKGAYFHDIHASGDTVVAVGYALINSPRHYQGFIYTSLDSGKSWASTLFSGHLFESIEIQGKHGFAVGHTLSDEGVLYETKDGGINWTLHHSNTANTAYSSIANINDSNWIITGSGASRFSSPAALHSYDNGATWKSHPISYPTNASLDLIEMVDDSVGFAVHSTFYNGVYSGNRVFKTYNAGKSWQLSIQHSKSITDIHIVNKQLGFFTDEMGSIYRTVNAGFTWSSVHIGKNVRLTSITSYNDTGLIAAGANGTMYISQHKGDNWKFVESPTTATPTTIKVQDNRLFLIGDQHSIYVLPLIRNQVFVPEDTLSVTETNKAIHEAKVYPNPIAPSSVVTIKCDLKLNTYGNSLSVINEVGAIVFQSNFEGNAVQFESPSIPGAYAVIISNESTIVSKRLIVF